MNIYIVEIGIDYEGETAVRAFTNRADAEHYASEIQKRLELPWRDENYLTGDYALVQSIPLDDYSVYSEAEL